MTDALPFPKGKKIIENEGSANDFYHSRLL
jgi:hypothetical protein